MPKVNIPDKICSHCGGNDWYLDPKRNYYTCYLLRQLRIKKYANSHIEELKIRKKAHQIKNKEAYKVASRKFYRKKRWEKDKKLVRNYPFIKNPNYERDKSRKDSKELKKHYLKKELKKMGISDPTEKEIEIYRENLKVVRICRKIKKSQI